MDCLKSDFSKQIEIQNGQQECLGMFDNLICTPSQINLLTFPDLKIISVTKLHFQSVAYKAFKFKLK